MRTCLALAIGSMLLTGCSSIAGRWEAAGDQARGDFHLASATFNTDKTFEATSEYSGRTQTSTGKYSFNGFTLKLMPVGREPRSYSTSLDFSGKTLKVKHDNGQTVTMHRMGCPADCCDGCCNKTCAAGCNKPCCKKT